MLSFINTIKGLLKEGSYVNLERVHIENVQKFNFSNIYNSITR